jgi:diguanylate cyclase (GGDEF)-like protein
MRKLSKSEMIGTAAALAGVVAVGVLDQYVGTEVGLALFYLVPIAACGWWVGRYPAILVALVAAAYWVAADLANSGNAWTSPTVWNGFTRVVVFLFAGLVLAELRKGRRELELLLEREAELARTDLLTGLPNSRAFLLELDRAMANAERAEESVAVGYIDLDNFKQVNDHYGHDRGDDLLKQIATILTGSLRRGDLVARLGGDEFAVLFNDADVGEVEPVARRIIERIVVLGANYPQANLSASVGLAVVDVGGWAANDLLKRADDAMYRAKQDGKKNVAIG